ncbi:MAG: RHS repeat domain-containing protein [Thermodesulfobacteriota bacterium]
MKRMSLFGVAVFLLLAVVGTSSPAMGATYSYDALNRLVGVTHDNCATISYSYDAAGNLLAIAVSAGTRLAGDLDAGGTVALADAIVGLQWSAGLPVAVPTLNRCAEVDGDGRLGLHEVIYIMRKEAGL